MACVPKKGKLSRSPGSFLELVFRYETIGETGSDELMTLASDLATYIGAEGPTDTSTGTLYIQLPTRKRHPGSSHGGGPESCARAQKLPRKQQHAGQQL